MIVSASYRTDIPAFYGDWFARRLADGLVRVRNPYGGPDYTVSLAPADVDGFVFWTRNIAPFEDVLAALAGKDRPFVVQYTITGYPAALERSSPSAQTSVARFRALADRFGKRAVVWRYDPVIFTDLTPAAWHETRFSTLARALAGATDEVVISFAQIYRKTRRNLTRAADRHGFGWSDPPVDAKRDLARRLAQIAVDHGLRLTICAQPDIPVNGMEGSKCIDAARLSDVAARPITARIKGNRPGCLCSESRDIGAYDSCAMGCAYCYAVADRDRASAAHRAHDSAAPSL